MTEKEREGRIAKLNHIMNVQGQDLKDYYTATAEHWKKTQQRINQEIGIAEALGLAEVIALAAYMANKMMIAGFEAGLDEPFEPHSENSPEEQEYRETRQNFLEKIEKIKNGEER